MGVWISTGVLIMVFAAIVWSEIKCGRRSHVSRKETDRQINALARTTFDRYREKFGRDPTGSFPLQDGK